ncbi:MAG: single-stranded-DNA-specific exonuclease RecJ [Thermodesulfobacteriota bacterium]
MDRKLPEKHWEFQPVGQRVVLDGIPSLISSLLAQRGFASCEDVEEFLNPSLSQLPLPTEMSGLAEAVAILEKGLADKTTVLIYGDYDADGITSTALLLSFFREIGLACCYYIPDRLTEGYGLNVEALQRVRSGPDLVDCQEPILITVDCGISAHAEVVEAQRLGFKVIVTDHHQPPPTLPAAEAVINPHRKDCLFPYKELAGVGVAFYLVAALRARLLEKKYWPQGRQPNLKKYLDLVAIGSVADMVSLTGANRVMVKAGLEVMVDKPRPGVLALMKKAGISPASINSGHIGFQVAPRINAAGRVGDPRLAVELLVGEEPAKVAGYANELEDANKFRKELSEKIFQEACRQAEVQMEMGRKTLVLVNGDWHVGVAGLVASRIAKAYYRPVIVLVSGDKGLASGSVRSIDGINMFEVLEECSDLLEKFGGHKAAAGLTVKNKAIDDFSAKFEASVNRKIEGIDLRPTIRVNLRASINELMDDKFLEYYEKLEPFGHGNREPVFCNAGETVDLFGARKIGKDSMRFRLGKDGAAVSGVAFGMAHLLPTVKDGAVKLAFTITKNEFRGTSKWEVRAEDIKTPT